MLRLEKESRQIGKCYRSSLASFKVVVLAPALVGVWAGALRVEVDSIRRNHDEYRWLAASSVMIGGDKSADSVDLTTFLVQDLLWAQARDSA